MDDKFTWNEYVVCQCSVGVHSVLEVWNTNGDWYWKYVSDTAHKTDYMCSEIHPTAQEAKDAALLWYSEYTTPIQLNIQSEMMIKSADFRYLTSPEKLNEHYLITTEKNYKSLQDILDEIKSLNLPNRYVEVFEYQNDNIAVCHIRKLESQITLCEVRPKNTHSSFYLKQEMEICDKCVKKFQEKKKKK